MYVGVILYNGWICKANGSIPHVCGGDPETIFYQMSI